MLRSEIIMIPILLTMSVIRGSSGFGSAIRSWIDVNIVDTFRDGFQAPFKDKKYKATGTLFESKKQR